MSLNLPSRVSQTGEIPQCVHHNAVFPSIARCRDNSDLLHRIPWPMERGEAYFLFCASAMRYRIVLLTILFRNLESASKTHSSQFTSLKPILPTTRRYRARKATLACHRSEHVLDECKS